mmetsp:Transcript_71386/g.201517  ORF Transcript_71386/g.201517 Transcript_71386/m.201517 type:complete len:217 (+) Transcript_71386:1168-1818(+)
MGHVRGLQSIPGKGCLQRARTPCTRTEVHTCRIHHCAPSRKPCDRHRVLPWLRCSCRSRRASPCHRNHSRGPRHNPPRGTPSWPRCSCRMFSTRTLSAKQNSEHDSPPRRSTPHPPGLCTFASTPFLHPRLTRTLHHVQRSTKKSPGRACWHSLRSRHPPTAKHRCTHRGHRRASRRSRPLSSPWCKPVCLCPWPAVRPWSGGTIAKPSRRMRSRE